MTMRACADGFAPRVIAKAGHGRDGDWMGKGHGDWMGKSHGDWGRPPWAAFFDSRGGQGGRGPGFPFTFFGGPRPPKARRGDVRTGILAVLADGARNGYQIIQEISERSGGAWKPSPG